MIFDRKNFQSNQLNYLIVLIVQLNLHCPALQACPVGALTSYIINTRISWFSAVFRVTPPHLKSRVDNYPLPTMHPACKKNPFAFHSCTYANICYNRKDLN